MRVSKMPVSAGREETWLLWETREPRGRGACSSSAVLSSLGSCRGSRSRFLLRVGPQHVRPHCSGQRVQYLCPPGLSHPRTIPLTCEPCPPRRKPPWTAGTAPGPWTWLCHLCSTKSLQGQGWEAVGGEELQGSRVAAWASCSSFYSPLPECSKSASHSHPISWAPGLGVFRNSLF